MNKYCKCGLLLITERERKTGVCRLCELPKAGVVLGEQILVFKKDAFGKGIKASELKDK